MNLFFIFFIIFKITNISVCRLEGEGYELFGEELGEGEYEYETEDSSESEQSSSREKDEHVLESMKESEENVKSRTVKSVSFAETEGSVKKDETLRKMEDIKSEDVEGSEEDILRIEFSHSSSNPVIKSDGDSIESPADIYKIFSKPKSILKRSPNDVTPVQAAPPDYSTEEDEEEEEESNKPSAYETVRILCYMYSSYASLYILLMEIFLLPSGGKRY